MSAPRRPYVTLEPDGEAWRATWHLPAPARALRFDRETPFRASLFEVVTPGYAIVRDGNAEVLRTDDPPSASITVRFPEHTDATALRKMGTGLQNVHYVCGQPHV